MALHLADTPGSKTDTAVQPRRRSAASARNRPRVASFLVMSAITFAGTLLAYFRVSDMSSKTVWAEDGALFLHEYLDQGAGLLNPYAGYLHLLPRFIVAIVTPAFGLEAYPVSITVACSIVVGLVAALTYYCASALTTNVAARLCWASIPVLIAPGAIETMGNVANLHWYLLWLAPWVLMKSPSAWGQKLLLGASALVIGLTEIQSALFLPLVLFRLRDSSLWWAKAGLTAGIACQLYSMWMYPRFQGGTGEDGDLLSIVYGYFLNSSAAIVFGNSPAIIDHIQNFGGGLIALTALPFAGIIILLIRWGNPVHRLTGSVWLFSSSALWAAAVVINPAPYFHYSGFDTHEEWGTFFLSRYSAVPSMFLLALIPLLISIVDDRPPRTLTSWESVARGPQFRGALLGAFLILQTVHFFPIDAARSTGPEWSPQIETSREACSADSELESVEILQAPGTWVTKIRCEDLLP